MKNKLVKFLAVALTAVMLVGILPTIAFAEDPIEVTSVVITDPPVLNSAYTEKEVRATFADTAVCVDPDAGYSVNTSNTYLLANNYFANNDTAVLVFIPPAVPTGEPPINIRIKHIITD